MALVDAIDLEDIRDLGEEGMTTEFTITRSSQVPVDPLDPGYDPSTDYGDDVLGAYTPVTGALQPVGVTTGWLVSKLVTNVSTGQGQLATVDMHILRMPVGVDVKPQDILVSTDTGAEYLVIDTNADDTWPEWFQANVKRRE